MSLATNRNDLVGEALGPERALVGWVGIARAEIEQIVQDLVSVDVHGLHEDQRRVSPVAPIAVTEASCWDHDDEGRWRKVDTGAGFYTLRYGFKKIRVRLDGARLPQVEAASAAGGELPAEPVVVVRRLAIPAASGQEDKSHDGSSVSHRAESSSK